MSFVTDQIRRIDAQLDRLASNRFASEHQQPDGISSTGFSTTSLWRTKKKVPRIIELQRLVKTLSTSAGSTTTTDLASAWTISKTLYLADLQPGRHTASEDTSANSDEGEESDIDELRITRAADSYEHQLEWLLLCKATAQTYGAVLNVILAQTLELNGHIWYWDEVLSSNHWMGVYSLQTAPMRIWGWTRGLVDDVRTRQAGRGLQEGWRQFYALVRETVEERSLKNLQARAVGPLARVRGEARAKQRELRRLKEVNSNALGVLLGEGLSSIEDAVYNSEEVGEQSHVLIVPERRDSVAKSIVLMEAVLEQVQNPEVDVENFEEHVSAARGGDTWFSSLENGYSGAGELQPHEVSARLQQLLTSTIPVRSSSFAARLSTIGRPSRLLRYWLPATALLLSSGTILRILVARKAEVTTWIREFGATVRDFWMNWVVEPTRKVVGTIRHDEGSEVAILSKRSLEGDRESLERMVLDFVKDTPETKNLSEAQLGDIRVKIREGDLTPVLKVYEKDMQSPVMGALRGNLIRSLLIQVQKTKVDVEVAMGGIDALLKSQELVFGFVGLTPGLLVTFSALSWLNSTFLSRSTSKSSRKRSHMLGVLRNIDRILTAAQPSADGVLYYKDYGLLLCEAHVLRQLAATTFPKGELREFLVDLEELTDLQMGWERQVKVVRRMRWGYARWF